jgi:hypothetical protein
LFNLPHQLDIVSEIIHTRAELGWSGVIHPFAYEVLGYLVSNHLLKMIKIIEAIVHKQGMMMVWSSLHHTFTEWS